MSPGPRACDCTWTRPSTGIRQGCPVEVAGSRPLLLRAERTASPVDAFLVSFGVIFVAELGDKSQLMALTFSARYRALTVLIGITIATPVVHAGSVLVGGLLGATLPTAAINIVAGVAFLGFAWGTWRGGTPGEEEGARARWTTTSPHGPTGPRAPRSWPRASRSSSPSSGTRRCSPRSRSRRRTAGSGP